MINAIQFRDSLDAFKNLKSPLQQFAYLIDLFFSKHHTETEDAPDEKEWNRLTELLDEVEMNYFVVYTIKYLVSVSRPHPAGVQAPSLFF
nr:hypothetical protein [uncultured Chryseobacterium sp.]